MGYPADFSGLGGIGGLARVYGHRANLSRIHVHRVGVSDTVVRETLSLVITKIIDLRTTSLSWADRPPPKVLRNPFRSDLTVPQYSGSCYWKVCLGIQDMLPSVERY